MGFAIAVVVIAAACLVGSMMLRPKSPAPPPPKPFGLRAFEAHGLAEASADVLKAVVATISFLGHPFTVVDEANAEMARANAREARDRQNIAENLREIEDLRKLNEGYNTDALDARARASQMDALVEQVKSVVGAK